MSNNFAQTLSTAYIDNIANFTNEDLEKKARVGDTTLAEHVAWSPNLVIPELPAGWSAMYIGKKDVGQRGRIILLPNDTWSRRVYRIGQMSIATKAGLTEAQAKVWVDMSGVRFKHELLDVLVKTLADENLCKAYESWKDNFNKDEDMKWRSVNRVNDGLSLFKRSALKAMIVALKAPPKTKAREGDNHKAFKKTIPGLVTLDQGWALVEELSKGMRIPFTFDEYKDEYTRLTANGTGLRDVEIRAVMDKARREQEHVAEQHASAATPRGMSADVAVIDVAAFSDADAEKRLALSRTFDSLALGDRFKDDQGFNWSKVAHDTGRAEETTKEYARGNMVRFESSELVWPDFIEIDGHRVHVSGVEVVVSEGSIDLIIKSGDAELVSALENLQSSEEVEGVETVHEEIQQTPADGVQVEGTAVITEDVGGDENEAAASVPDEPTLAVENAPSE